ncbi:hypothetical protein THASP1DRAFT_28122 [Thamnocephalis sphaerospora]|uniref:Uncharacterized protein n=1 Tax=Thamnocephalis sphaerospora TaxID=78915 RepID=A0A4P9XUZ0_9FUNG|nr:hypothetical protein THASP1DRAFT_28122 [Thamnocephalis sphaerospora]|eukprot:RKP10077.1 hypothetical protein THASP1DRAFT_28122 [Thamnocephalis sphaerospora]
MRNYIQLALAFCALAQPLLTLATPMPQEDAAAATHPPLDVYLKATESALKDELKESSYVSLTLDTPTSSGEKTVLEIVERVTMSAFVDLIPLYRSGEDGEEYIVDLYRVNDGKDIEISVEHKGKPRTCILKESSEEGVRSCAIKAA